MDELSGKLEKLQIVHDIRHIDELLSKLKWYSYVSSATRSRVINLFRYELKISSADNIAALSSLERAFSQPISKYISREIVRVAITFLEIIKQRQSYVQKVLVQTDWSQHEWFHHLVDSDTVVEPLRILMDILGVCRHSVVSSMCIIVLSGSLEEKQFFEKMLVSSELLSLNMMDHSTARKVFKYYGGVTIEGSFDCARRLSSWDPARD